MTIAIIGGTGPEGSGLALRWARAGEQVVIGSRNAERAEATAASIAEQIRGGTGALARATEISGADNSSACASADIVVLTVPFEAHAETLKHLKPVLRPGQILVDTTVPLASSVGGRSTRALGVWQGSAAQQAAEIAGKRGAAERDDDEVGQQRYGAEEVEIMRCQRQRPEPGRQ